MKSDLDRMRIVGVQDESDCVRSFRLAGLVGERLPEWEPGAHLEIVLPSGLVRQYSLCGDPRNADEYQIAVLREPASRGGSVELHDEIKPGHELEVRAQRNNFMLRTAPSYLFVAGGVGITPILPMIDAAERQGIPWRLVYGGRGRSSMAFLERILAYGPERTDIVAEDERGFPDLAGEIAGTAGALVYACGPEGLLRAVEDAAAAEDLSKSLHLERFAAASDRQVSSAGSAFEVELRQTGKVLTVGEGTTILEAVREVLPETMSSCEEGFCGTCETRVVEGVPDHRDSLLSEEERVANDTMMICVSRAACGRLVLDL
ncbi:MAG: PDR/VanB family oxidoreductase [Mycobacterium sp.]